MNDRLGVKGGRQGTSEAEREGGGRQGVSGYSSGLDPQGCWFDSSLSPDFSRNSDGIWQYVWPLFLSSVI